MPSVDANAMRIRYALYASARALNRCEYVIALDAETVCSVKKQPKGETRT